MQSEVKMELPFVSVVMPVYNGEDVIERSLESLLNQTYTNLEVIVVNDGSTDRTLDILNSYKNTWKDKLQVISIENSGQGRARTVGIHHAKGALLGFCDADDYYKLYGFEKMVDAYIKSGSDVLYLPLLRQKGYYVFRTSEISPPYTQSTIISTMRIIGFCNLLVKKELLLELGDIPSMVYEDIAYVGALLTRARKLVYYPAPVYYYVDTQGSVTDSTMDPRILQLTDAIDWALVHANKKYRPELLMALAKKCLEKMKSVWYYGDLFQEKLWDMKGMIEQNPVYLENPQRYTELKNILELQETSFPSVVYVDGISRDVSKEIVKEIEKKAFRDGARVVILQDTSDTDESSKGFKDNRALAAYLGIQKILETGGIFIGNNIKVCGPFDCMCHFPAFFGYEHGTLVSSQVFGGQKEDKVLTGLFNCWTRELRKDALSIDDLAQLATNFLVDEYELNLDGVTTYTKYPFVTLEPTAVSISYQEKGIHLCEKIYDTVPDNAVILSQEQIAYLVDRSSIRQNKKNFNRYTEIVRLKYRLEQQKNRFEQRINNLENTRAYKVGTMLENYMWGRIFLKILNHFV